MNWPSVAWGLKRISSREVSEWHAILTVEAEEAEEARKRASSKGGKSGDASSAGGARRMIGGRKR